MEANQNPPIWNPVRAVGLSVILTPAFGSYVHASNWKTLGKPNLAAASMKWFYFSLLVLFVMALGSVSLVRSTGGDSDGSVRGILNGVALVYLIIWYGFSGRHQVNYVKETFGKAYAKKSMWKPVLTGLAGVVAYTAAVVGLMAATQGVANADGSTGSGGSSFNLAGLIGGNHGLDCAAPNVKELIIQNASKPLIGSGIPDLASGVQKGRIKLRLDTIHETTRNNDAKNVDCAANLTIDFPKDELDRATQQGEIFQAVMLTNDLTPITDPSLLIPVTYQVATPSDPAEAKDGSIVTMTSDNKSAARSLQAYMAYYEVLAFAEPDITAASKNTTPWTSDFKQSAIQACSKTLGAPACTCQMNTLEKVVSDDQLSRMVFTMQNSPVLGKKYTNITKLRETLQTQCPLTQSLSSLLGGEDAAPVAAQPVTAPPTEAPQPSAVQPQQPVQAAAVPAPVAPVTAQPAPVPASAPATAQAAIVASFDCTKAASKIEKLTCSTPETATADRNLAAAYRTAETKSADPAGLKQGQRTWLKERNVCNDAACLLKMTNDRIQTLSGM